MAGTVLPWTAEQAAQLGVSAMKAPHSLQDHSLFRDDALIDLLDRIPRSNLQVFTMGLDPASTHDWRRGSTEGSSAQELWQAVQAGRLWFNVIRVDSIDTRYAELLQEIFAGLESRVPGLRIIDGRATLLISSPEAQVYYHADAQPNLLWQMRGVKRVWVYPALDPAFVSEKALGRIFTGETDEQLPYEPSYDASSQVMELHPGEVASWPQNAPHRVANVEGVNISLSTEYVTAQTARRAHLRAANRVLTRFGVPARSTRERGLVPTAKVYAYRGARRAGLVSQASAERPMEFVVAPHQPLGYQLLPETGTGSNSSSRTP